MGIPILIPCTLAIAHCTTSPPPSTSSPFARDINDDEMRAVVALLLRQALRGDYTTVNGVRSIFNTRKASSERWVVEYVDRISAIAASPESVLTDSSVEVKVREIGREIYELRGHEGMVAVCEYNRSYKPYIERAWDGIGSWLA
jgi:hypothetical protein